MDGEDELVGARVSAISSIIELVGDSDGDDDCVSVGEPVSVLGWLDTVLEGVCVVVRVGLPVGDGESVGLSVGESDGESDCVWLCVWLLDPLLDSLFVFVCPTPPLHCNTSASSSTTTKEIAIQRTVLPPRAGERVIIFIN
jgi:hypothetical protein